MIARAVSVALVLAAVLPVAARAAPAVVWLSEPAAPGDVVLAQGGGLDGVRDLRVWRLGDGDPGPAPAALAPAPPPGAGAARVPAVQPSSASLKFVLPASLPPGVFAVDAGGGARLMGRPRVDWAQATRLAPGLDANEAAPGTALQIIGRNFAGASPAGGGAGGGAVRVALRSADGRETAMRVTAADRYSIVADVPADLTPGEYALWVHNGFGGPAGWGGGGPLRVRRAAAWPAHIVNMRALGARGDNVTDDSAAFRQALETLERRGGGVVFFPAGTYRLAGAFRLPRRVVLRGEGMDLTWLKWPLTAPRGAADFVPAVLAAPGEFGIEGLSLMVRNAQTVLRGGGDGARDVFLREVRIHYLPWAGRPAPNPEGDPQWAFSRWGIINATDKDLAVLLRGVETLEVSDSEFVGSQRFLDVRNARLTGNRFGNPMGVAWTDVGGQHVIFERNRVEGASSWRPGALPLRWIYGADNTTRNLGRGEREAFTFDVNRSLGAARERGTRVEPRVGAVASATGRELRLAGGELVPGVYRGFDALIVAGRGAGQYREVEDNDAHGVRVAGDWDVTPDGSSAVLLTRLMGHCVFQRNSAEDVSVLLQMWGPLYDCTFDGNTVARSQGMWGLGGWRIQWLGNVLEGAVTYQSGIGPSGPTPDRTAEYGYLGFTISGRVTEVGRFEYVRGAVLRGNRLSRGHRVLVMWGYGGERRHGRFAAARDVIVDRNRIAHSPVGIELDANVEGAVVAGNAFIDVEEPFRLHAPEKVTVLNVHPKTGGSR